MSIKPTDIRSIFDQVVDLPPTERAAVLGRLTDNNPALRAEVEALLASHDAAAAGGFMSSPTAATTIRNAVITETPGTRIGPYKLLQVIGEGGFGTVFLAEQSEPVRRRVALKIIKLGMDTKQVIARFEAERQALALMDHPHIARVLDAGATPVTEHGGGRPYFVMEYVVGDAITEFAANNNLDIRARLELFAQVCSAVQHAHTKGIIHRDIKPGNVLVTMTDGKPFARVIDFGIAKATASAGGLTDKTLFTEHRQLIGTPEYMSPEQAQGSPDIDTRTDVYALGVLLYELLAGDTPFDGKRLRSAAWDEMRRIIKEEDPPTPSARVTQRMKSGGSASSPSAPLTLRPSAPSDLRGELDWIVMKSLDKDRARRYETPSALAADVERHLKGEAVQAAPPSAAYRLKKFVRRNKGPVIVGSTVVIAILAGSAIALVGWREASALARAKQKDQERAAAKVAATFSQIFNTDVPWPMKPEPGESVLVATSPDRHTKVTRAATPDGTATASSISSDGREQVPPLSDSLDALSYVSAMAISGLDTTNKELRAQTDAAEWSAYTANLALAQAAMEAGNWPEARERLAQCPESKRGWEWRWLHEKAHAVIGEVRGAATYVSPDASRVIATDTRSLRIATPDGTAIGSPIVFESPISELAFAPDGSAFLVALAADSTWNREYRVFTREGHPVGAPDAPPIIGRSATISPDGQRLIAVVPTERGLATHLLDATGTLIRSLASVPTEAYDTSWSGDGERVAIITPHRLDVFNRDGEPIASLDAPGDRLGKPALAPDGSRIAFVRIPGGTGQTPRTELWTMDDFTPSTLTIPSDFPQTVSFSPDSEFMYVRLWGQPTLYVTRNGVEVGRITSPNDLLSDPILSPDGSKFLLATRTTVSIHAPDGSRIGAPIPHGSGWVDSACFAPDGESIHSASYHRGTIEQRDLSGKLLSRASIGTSMHYVACTPDGLVLAALLNDFSDIAVATVLLSPNAALSDRSFASSISEIGRLEADARNHTDQQRDTPSQAAAAEHAAIAPHAPHRITTPDGSRLVSADADRVVRLWDTASGLETASFRMTGDIARLQLSPDGEALTIRMADGSLRMLDARPASAHAGDIEAWNSQMPAALAIVEKLVESDAPTDDLMNAVLNDASLIPLRRMLAAELLTVRLSEIEYDARRALATITRDQTDKAAVLAAAAALQPSDALPPRAIEKVVAWADSWEHRPSTPPAEERLAQERLDRQLAEAKRISDAADDEPILRDMIRQALADQIELLGIDDPAVPLTLSRFGAFNYTHGLSLSDSDWPTAQRIVAAWRANPRASQTDLARVFAGAAAIAVDAGQFKSAAELFAELALISADAREGLTPYFSVWLCLPSGIWDGEVTEVAVRNRAIASFAEHLDGWYDQLEKRPDSETRHIRELLDWLETIPAYREPLSSEIARLRQRLDDHAREGE